MSKNRIAGARGSRSAGVVTSDGIRSLEASCMTQMFVGFASRCCSAPRGGFYAISRHFFLNKKQEIRISQTSWSRAGSQLSTGPDSADGRDREEDLIERLSGRFCRSPINRGSEQFKKCLQQGEREVRKPAETTSFPLEPGFQKGNAVPGTSV